MGHGAENSAAPGSRPFCCRRPTVFPRSRAALKPVPRHAFCQSALSLSSDPARRSEPRTNEGVFIEGVGGPKGRGCFKKAIRAEVAQEVNDVRAWRRGTRCGEFMVRTVARKIERGTKVSWQLQAGQLQNAPSEVKCTTTTPPPATEQMDIFSDGTPCEGDPDEVEVEYSGMTPTQRHISSNPHAGPVEVCTHTRVSNHRSKGTSGTNE